MEELYGYCIMYKYMMGVFLLHENNLGKRQHGKSLCFIGFLSLLLIKSGLGCQCSQARGRVMRCMIPFWIHLLTGIQHIQVLFVWVQFDQKNGSVENSESRATPGGYL